MTDNTNYTQMAEPASQGTMWTGAGGSAAVWYLELGDTLALIAAGATILGAAFSAYFGWQRHRRQRELHALQVEKMRRELTNEKDD